MAVKTSTRNLGMKRGIGLLLVGVAAIAIATFTVFRGQGQDQVKIKQEQPTIIQEGQISDKQKQHGKLFKHPGTKLKDLAARQGGDITVEEGTGLVMVMPETRPLRPVFQSALCNADLVVIGMMTDKSSQLTEQENFVFTDYQVSIEEVLKNSSPMPIKVGDMVTTTRDGGVVQLNGRVFQAKRDDFDAPVLGQPYLLFLRFIPTTSSYVMYGNGTFELGAQRVQALGPGARDEIAKQGLTTSSAFLAHVRSFAAADCGK